MLSSTNLLKKIKDFHEIVEEEVCFNHLNAFWERKKHQLSCPYEQEFQEKDITTKARQSK